MPDYLALARQYVELSNQHKLDEIFPLFAKDATYGSTGVGQHKGIEQIEEMMRGFFGRFTDVRWEVPEYKLVGPGRVEFGFIRHFTDEAGQAQTKQGVELIVFSEDGKITHIEVKA